MVKGKELGLNRHRDSLLPADKVKDDQGHTSHAESQKAQHDEHGEILSLGDEAIWICLASGTGERKQGSEVHGG